jgi:hypothetical protein
MILVRRRMVLAEFLVSKDNRVSVLMFPSDGCLFVGWAGCTNLPAVAGLELDGGGGRRDFWPL